MVNTNELPTATVKPAAKKTGFRTQVEAKAAAVFELGEFARHGFEYETWKCDKRWFFKKCDEVKPPTAADLKASGGKRGPKAEAAARAKADQERHEQRGAERAAGEGRLREGTSLTALAIAIETGAPVPELEVVVAPVPSPAEQVAEAEKTGDVPAFLKRTGTKADIETVRAKRAKDTGPERIINNPPDAKQAKAKKRSAANKTALVGAMFLDPKGVTTADVLKATGWKAVNMPRQAKAFGLKVRLVKDGGKVTRYFGSK